MQVISQVINIGNLSIFRFQSLRISMLRSKLKSEEALSTKEPGNEVFFFSVEVGLEQELVLHVVGITLQLLFLDVFGWYGKIKSLKILQWNFQFPSCWMDLVPISNFGGTRTKDDESSESQRVWIETVDLSCWLEVAGS